jgi:hypothetical protein
MGLEELHQLRVTSAGGGELAIRDRPTQMVQNRHVMGVLVSVDPSDQIPRDGWAGAVLDDCHARQRLIPSNSG